MPYAILRTAKLTSLGSVGGSAQHNFRERDTPNADPERTALNRTSGAQSSKELVAGVKARLATQDKVRKNAVLAVEYFVGASPEWFSQADPKQREAYFDQAEKWLKERHGAENVIAVTRQYDETSPHVCAYVVPIDPKGKLNCSHFLDGREKLTQMQTDFADKVGRQFGLERGIEGSKAKHKTIKQYYAEIQAPVREVTISPESVQPKVLKKGFLSSEHETPEMVAERLTKAVQNAYRPAVQAAKQHHAEKAANEARARELAQLRATATVARDMPLEGVLERLGCERDPKDRKNWRTPAGRITVDGSKFFAHDVGKGGGGAIDLTMMVEQTDYKGAVNWLAREFGTGAVLEQTVAVAKRAVEVAAKAPPQPYKAPEPSPEHWPRVRHYLTEVRRLSAGFVDRVHELGKLYADRYANAVFVLGKGEGVELRGTGEKPFHGVRGEKKPFIMADRGEPKVAFVESAIDAMSLSELGFKGRIVSMAGSSAAQAKERAEMYRQQGLTVVAAFDNDRAGEQMAAQLGYPRERIYPEHGKDWNDDLRVKRATPAERQAMEQEARQERTRQRSGPSLG
jgi:hypothetical protein